MQESEFRPDYRQQNPWWQSGDVTSATRYHRKRRSDYQYKLDRVRRNRFVMIAGAAGSGKTTTLHQIADDLIRKHNVPATNVLYLPLGDPRFQIGSNIIEETIRDFATYFWHRDDEVNEGYVLLDDVHAIESWNQQVRECLNEYPQLTIAVTVPTIERTETEPIEELGIEPSPDVLLPSKFYDVVSETTDIEVEKEIVRSLRNQLGEAAATGDTGGLSSAVNAIEDSVGDSASSVKRTILSYFQGESRDDDADNLSRNLELTVYRDVPRYQQFDQRSDLHTLCAIAAMYPGQTFNMKDLSKLLGCDRRTLQRYIDVLEDFLVLTPSYQYDYSRRRSVRLYVRDPVLLSALTELDVSGLLDQEAEQKLTTTVLFDHLKRLAFHYHKTNQPVQFWESGSDSIDFVVETEEGCPIPIVMGSRADYEESVDAIEVFQKENGGEVGLIVGRDFEAAVNENVAVLPLWLFLLSC